MKKNYTHISFVLDRSGSMASTMDDTIGGFNKFLEDQQKEKGTCTLSMMQFDTEFESLYTFKKIKEVPKLNEETFKPRGMTALLDAIGKTIVETEEEIKRLDKKNQPEKVLFVILTDGQENSSKEYKKIRINEMIKDYGKKNKWQFIFLGANQNAIHEAGGLGIKMGNAMNFVQDTNGIKASYNSLSRSISNYRDENVDADMMSDMEAFSEEDREEQNKAWNK